MSRIRFRIVPPVDRSSDRAYVIGSHPELGDWNPATALPLTWKDPYLEGEFEVEAGTPFEYKILRGSWEAEAVDAFGHVPGNYSHEAWLDTTLHHTVADWKDRYHGRLTRDRIHSRGLAGWRDLLVWLPQSYAAEPNRRFPVIILHDGDNVFNPLTSNISGVDLAADEWVSLLSSQGVMPESLVVGVCHPEGFSEENDSLRDFDLSPELGGAAYAHFVATELVSHMDTHYRTFAKPQARALGGVSLGALNSFYTALRHPGVFGNFLCLSTSFEDISQSLPAHSGQLQVLAVEPALPDGVRMYFDYGTEGLDECYAPYHADLGSLLREKGWQDGGQFVIRKIEGGKHDELSWRSRFGDALRFIAGSFRR
ncbi:MAG: alpha/beta hydrolase-fold protein [Terrimicrobiaceae bacterium]